ncbi:MAG: histidine--tRNA ligase [Oscillospiraceae bacterium]|jgi:histidine--tRNA ligase|nr:histidine--tRNA ligase [Oscillospiraceae bacterium]
MAKVAPRTLSGFMELLPAAQMKMEKMMETLRKSYSVYGFTPLDTPVIESAEVLLAKGGGETEKQIYRFSKGDSDLALRFDLTVPLAKYVAANYANLSFPFRRYQIGKVYRGERAQRGRFREFYQADIDIIGDGRLDIINEAEIPAIIYRTFTALGLRKFKIKVNNRKLLNGFYALAGMSEKAGDIMRCVDKLDKIGAVKVRQLLMDELHMFSHKADDVMDFMAISGTNAEVIAGLERYRGMNELFDEGLEELITVTKYLSDFGVPEENFAVDLSIARGLDYYTGTVYETEMTEHPEIGSICSGGRYDDLAGYYTDKTLPGVGISIGLTRLFYVLNEQGLLSEETVSAPADALVIPMTEELGFAISAATVLRDVGVRTQLYCEKKKFKAKMSYADKLGIPYVVLIGEDEMAEGVVAVKDMLSGQQQKLSPEQAAAFIKNAMDERALAAVIKE